MYQYVGNLKNQKFKAFRRFKTNFKANKGQGTAQRTLIAHTHVYTCKRITHTYICRSILCYIFIYYTLYLYTYYFLFSDISESNSFISPMTKEFDSETSPNERRQMFIYIYI